MSTRLKAIVESGHESMTTADSEFCLAIALQSESVRTLQKQYFANRNDKSLLEASKASERQLDRLLSEPAQGGLFD